MSRPVGLLARASALLLSCVAAIALAILAFPLADYQSAQVLYPDGTVAVLAQETRQTGPASVELDWSARRQVGLGDLTGIITDVFVTSGVPLACGSPVVEIDGATRLAMCGAVPPWRNVTASTEGPDADQLATLLVELGLVSRADSSNGAVRAAGWEELASRVGLPPSGTFHPSDVVWIGASTTPSRVGVQVGDFVSEGSVLFEVDEDLRGAIVHAPTGEPRLSLGWLFSADGSAAEFPVLSSGSLDVASFAPVARSLVADSEESLPSQIRGTVRMATPISFAAFPPSAVVTAEDGSTCVVLADGRVESVTIVDSSSGLVMAEGNLAEGTLLDAYPPADATC